MSTLYTNRLFLNGDKVKQMYINGSKVYQLVEGTAPVPPTPTPYEEQYLTFEILSAGTIVWKTSNASIAKTISYSKDDGNTWTSITSTTAGTSFNVDAGDEVLFKGNNAAYGSSDDYSTFSGSAAKYNLYGNIMSLISGDEFSGSTTLTSSYNFKRLFAETSAVNASNLVLPATTLTEGCYYYMFQGCTSLTSAPALPATTLADYCYSYMFANCTSLTSAPSLPATTIADYCYFYMFRGCTSLTSAPELLATTLADFCYSNMFQGCTSLTSAPSLPATTLTERCYNYMFQGCTSLTTAPELPATTLESNCYRQMFQGCTNLNYIKCLATDISASNCTFSWVSGVASSGTFVKSASMSGWSTGTSGIPANWTVQDAS